jgi:predicted CoA-binding protein
VTKAEAIRDFLSQRKLAVAGASRSAMGFGAMVLKALRSQGYRVYAVNPRAAEVCGQPCYANLAALPEPVDGVFVAVPRAACESVVREAAAAGIRRVWIQQGCESPEALAFCAASGITVVAKECILMFAAPRGFHRFHHWVWEILGKLSV